MCGWCRVVIVTVCCVLVCVYVCVCNESVCMCECASVCECVGVTECLVLVYVCAWCDCVPGVCASAGFRWWRSM